MKLTNKILEDKYGIAIDKEFNFGSGKEVLVVYWNGDRVVFDNLYQINEFMKKNRKGN